GTDLADVFVSGDLMATETTVNADKIAAVIESCGLRHFGTRVMAFITAGLYTVHRVHWRGEELFFLPPVLLDPFLSLFFTARHVARILEAGRAIEAIVAGRAAEVLHRMR